MNFISAFDELDKLYESVENEKLEKVTEDVIEGEEVEIEEPEIVEEDEVEETPVAKQVVYECNNCGALVVKNEDEEVAEDEECNYCGEAAGFKAIGTFEAYEEAAEEEAPEEDEDAEVIEIEDDEVEEADEEIMEEGLFDKTPKTIRGYKAGDIGFSQRIAKELVANFEGEIRQVKTKQGKEDVWVDTKNKARAAEKYITKKYPDAALSFNEYEQLI
jgi:DNA-directed RNA polymerase subunit RPC12/RpoP